MKNSNEEFSRTSRNQKSRSDQLLNWLIAAVVIGILIVGWNVLSPSKDPEQVEETPPINEEKITSEDDFEAPNLEMNETIVKMEGLL